MNNFFKIIFLFTLGLTVVSCSKSDDSTEPLRDYAEQYTKDIANIELFMHTHYMEVVNNPGAPEDQDVTFTLIPEGGTQTSIWDQHEWKERWVKARQNEVDVLYKIYYIPLRGELNRSTASAEDIEKAPSNVDKVFTSYRGEYLYKGTEQVNGVIPVISKEFEEVINPQSFFNLLSVIRGWGEIFPLFKAGTYSGNPDGTTSFFDFGAGVMFIPSGLAYYNGATAGIPSYSPLVFSFKLYEIQRVDNDGDGILSYHEDLGTAVVNSNGSVDYTDGIPDGYLYSLPEGVRNPDNTNHPANNTDPAHPVTGTRTLIAPNVYSLEDEVPDFVDTDDDGDYFTTESEIMDPSGEPYPFVSIPTCGGSGTKKKHLDPLCH